MSAARTALVIGGGIAGPVVAVALKRAGIQATIHEAHGRDTEPRGLTLTLAPNGLEALRIVDAYEAVQAVGLPMRGQEVCDGRGRRIGAFAPVAGQPPILALRRAELCRVLREHAETQKIPFRYGARLVDVDQQADGVTARFEDGSSANADVLIAADGIRSRVRALIDPGAPPPRTFPLLNVGGVANCRVAASSDRLHFVFGRRGFFGYWSEPDGKTAWFANVPDRTPFDRDAAAARPSKSWLAWLREVYADDIPARQVLAATDPADLVVVGPLESMPPLPTWSRGRLTLVGDAVHAPSPSSGQGASLAIESAIELARCLRDQQDPVAAFATYHALRRTRVAKIVNRGERTTSSKTVGPFGVAVMRLVMPLALRTFLNQERTLGPEQRFRINWDEPIGEAATSHA